jgi:hypothetical protein
VRRTFKKGDGKCRCGVELETCSHVLHRCTAPASTLGREQMAHHIHESIRQLWTEGELSAGWFWFLIHVFGVGKNGTTHTWTRGEEPQCVLCGPNKTTDFDWTQICYHEVG